MEANYKAFIDRMIQRYEGGYGWDRADAGGPTKYGITCWDLAAHRGLKMNSMRVWAPIVKAMGLPEAEEIYRTKYAKAVRFDELPSGVDCAWLDYAVNSGIGRPIKVVQAICGVAVDGQFGPKTMAAVQARAPISLIGQICAERMRFLRSLRNWPTFGRGWTARVNDLQAYCNRLAGSVVPTIADFAVADPAEMAKGYKVTMLSKLAWQVGASDTPFKNVEPVLT